MDSSTANGHEIFPFPIMSPTAASSAEGISLSSADQFYTWNRPTAALYTQSQPRAEWSTGLCDCFEDESNCCLTCWCPCITFGRTAEIIDRGSSSCGATGALYTLIMCMTGCSCLYSCFYRSKMRRQYFLKESPCNDCLVHLFCEQCAICQEYRELRNRGFDMVIGWHGNLEKQTRGITTMPPSVESGMKR